MTESEVFVDPTDTNAWLHQIQPAEIIRTVVNSDPRFQAMTHTLSDLAALLKEEEVDDYGILRPTNEDFLAAWNLVEPAGRKLIDQGSALTYGSSLTDGEGRIRAGWRNNDREVMLCVSSNIKGTYVYHRSSAGSGITGDVNADTLADKLTWMLNKPAQSGAVEGI